MEKRNIFRSSIVKERKKSMIDFFKGKKGENWLKSASSMLIKKLSLVSIELNNSSSDSCIGSHCRSAVDSC